MTFGNESQGQGHFAPKNLENHAACDCFQFRLSKALTWPIAYFMHRGETAKVKPTGACFTHNP